MRRDIQNKAETAVEADQIIKIPPKTCPQCGGPLTDFGCRYVPMGQWCLRGTLVEDPRRIIRPTPDPIKEAAEQDREVKRALADYERKTAEDEQATNAWRAAALAYHKAKVRRYSGSQTIVVDGLMRSIAPPGASDHEMAQLEALADQANTLRVHAAEQALKSRQQLDAARARARRKLSRVS